MLFKQMVDSPLGEITLLSDENDLRGLWFTDQQNFGAQYDLQAAETASSEPILAAETWLTGYFAGERPDPTLVPLAPEVTPYRLLVLHELRRIPYGTVVTYQTLAQRVAAATHRLNVSPRAIGGAVGHNPISLLIPCHRVVGATGDLTGYAGGLARKQALLELEGVTLSASRQKVAFA
ncbi:MULTISPECIES: methylated-DNA--[protein]-cysteine S-methyltransferase [Lacticaseibacillus]|uniref:Methylated-DNA--[protein]-cysteine S-methyltransferase n=2 Tax=Lacticaseibacillus TaxID=2759736 RepID=A0ABW4CJT1_9LACO|nr:MULTISPECIES: methylated-DNA--[protein]-cysteine S-methyltransferase [Lacticaseibacillus]